MTTFSCPRCGKLSVGFPCQCTKPPGESLITLSDLVVLILLCAIGIGLLVFSDPGVQP